LNEAEASAFALVKGRARFIVHMLLSTFEPITLSVGDVIQLINLELHSPLLVMPAWQMTFLVTHHRPSKIWLTFSLFILQHVDLLDRNKIASVSTNLVRILVFIGVLGHKLLTWGLFSNDAWKETSLVLQSCLHFAMADEGSEQATFRYCLETPNSFERRETVVVVGTPQVRIDVRRLFFLLQICTR
jgi:hypothetical protein